jgi:PAS domain S-box-containing protein
MLGETRRETAALGPTEQQWDEHDATLARREPFVDFRIERTRPGYEKEIFFINGRPFHDKDGNFAGYRGTGRDVSELMGMVEALEKNEAHLRQMLDAAPIGVSVIDADGKTEYANNRHLETLKIKAEDFVGLTGDRFYVDPAERAELLRLARLDGEVRDHEVQSKTNDGSVFPLSVSMQRTPNGNGQVISWSVDLTGRRDAERKILELQYRFQDFAEASSDWFWETDAEHKYVYFSEGIGVSNSFRRDELIGRSRRDFIQNKEFKTAGVREHLDEIDGHRPFRNRRFCTQRPGEALVWTSVSGRPFFDGDGHFLGYRGVGVNITSQVALEDALRDALNEAQAANSAKSEFLSSMSHELRTPLNSILGFSQLLTMDAERPLSTEQSEGVGQILKAGNHLLELINQVLDLSRIEQGHLSVAIEDIDPGEVLDDCLALISQQARARGLAIEMSGLEKNALPTVRADRVRMKQVLLNFLMNAVKYNTTGTRIGIHQVLAAGGSLRVEISDDGPGIPENSEEDIFKPFNRLGMEALEIEGTGIGLTISKELVGLMNGAIGFQKPVGGGAMFWFELPVSDGAPDAADHDRVLPLNMAARIPQPRRKILYIEDNPASLMFVQRAMEQLGGIEFLSAHTAELGIVMVQAQHPDLVLMDIDLPGMSGIDAMRVLRASKETANIPVVAISAVAMPDELASLDLDGFEQFLTKPLDLSRLLEIIDVTVRAASKQMT